MAFKTFQLEDVGSLTIYKRRGSHSMRLSIAADGSARLTMPTYLPYEAGLAFARTKRGWLQLHTPKRRAVLENGQAIGKRFRLRLTASFNAPKITSRLLSEEIYVIYPARLQPDDDEVQQIATNACIRALRREAEELLPGRVAGLAERYGFHYKSVVIKRLTGRWGSCDQDHNIVLNLFLMQLPWELIDYVIVHELVHTKHLHHGPDFWTEFLRHQPKARSLRKRINRYQPNFVLPQAL